MRNYMRSTERLFFIDCQFESRSAFDTLLPRQQDTKQNQKYTGD